MYRIVICVILICLQTLVLNAQEVYSYEKIKDIKDRVNVNDSTWLEMAIGTQTERCTLQYYPEEGMYCLVMERIVEYNEHAAYTLAPKNHHNDSYFNRELWIDGKKSLLELFNYCRRKGSGHKSWMYKDEGWKITVRNSFIDDFVTLEKYEIIPPSPGHDFTYYNFKGSFNIPRTECQKFYSAVLAFSETAEEDSVTYTYQSSDNDTLSRDTLGTAGSTIKNTDTNRWFGVKPYIVILLIVLLLLASGYIYYRKYYIDCD